MNIFDFEVGDEVTDWTGALYTIVEFDDDKGTRLAGDSGGFIWKCSSELVLTNNCKANKCINGYKELLDRVEWLEQLLDKSLEDDLDNQEPDPLWKQIFNQEEFFNGNGQMEIDEMSLSDIKPLLDDLSNNCGCIEDIFYVQLFSESGSWSGSIYQDMGSVDGSGKLWLTIENIIID